MIFKYIKKSCMFTNFDRKKTQSLNAENGIRWSRSWTEILDLFICKMQWCQYSNFSDSSPFFSIDLKMICHHLKIVIKCRFKKSSFQCKSQWFVFAYIYIYIYTCEFMIIIKFFPSYYRLLRNNMRHWSSSSHMLLWSWLGNKFHEIVKSLYMFHVGCMTTYQKIFMIRSEKWWFRNHLSSKSRSSTWMFASHFYSDQIQNMTQDVVSNMIETKVYWE